MIQIAARWCHLVLGDFRVPVKSRAGWVAECKMAVVPSPPSLPGPGFIYPSVYFYPSKF